MSKEVPYSEVEKTGKQQWRYNDTTYVLGYIPSECDQRLTRDGQDV